MFISLRQFTQTREIVYYKQKITDPELSVIRNLIPIPLTQWDINSGAGLPNSQPLNWVPNLHTPLPVQITKITTTLVHAELRKLCPNFKFHLLNNLEI